MFGMLAMAFLFACGGWMGVKCNISHPMNLQNMKGVPSKDHDQPTQLPNQIRYLTLYSELAKWPKS